MSAITDLNTGPRTTEPQHGLSFVGLLNSEWIKLRTLRSTFWCFAILIVLTIGIGAFIAFVATAGTSAAPVSQESSTFVWSILVLPGVFTGQLIVSVLGSLVITGEYGTGMIRSTMTAVPQRLPALFAKVLVFGATTFVVSAFSILATVLVALPMLAGRSIFPSVTDEKVWFAFLGAAVFLTFIGILSVAIGTMLRHSAAGIAGSLGLVLVAPIILNTIGLYTNAKWVINVAQFLPSALGQKLYLPQSDSIAGITDGLITLDSTQALFALIAWVAVALAAACLLLKRRDV